MKNCCFRGQNYRTFHKSVPQKQKASAREAFLMVPLDEGAVHLSLSLKTSDAFQAPRPTSLRSLVGLYVAPVSPITYY